MFTFMEENKTPAAIVPQPVETKPIATSISVGAADQMMMAQYEEANRAMLPTEKMLGVMQRFAQTCVMTQQMPSTINTAEKAIMVFQAGREMGIPPIKALYSFYFVNNKMTMYGPTVVERIRMWAKIEYIESTDEVAHIKITRKDDGTSLEAKVTMDELIKKGMAGKDTFKKHPKTMLLYKAVGQIVRHICPEAVGASAVEGDWGDTAETEQMENKPVVGRIGRVYEQNEAGETVVIKQEIPTVPMITKKFTREQIVERCEELGIEYEENATKGQLACKLVEKLKEDETV
jgi:hypothetical protein